MENTKVEKVVDYSNLLTLFFNYNNQFLKEKEVRSAIKMGVDREQFADLGASAKLPFLQTHGHIRKISKHLCMMPSSDKNYKKFSRESTDSAKLNFNTYYDYLDVAGDINKKPE